MRHPRMLVAMPGVLLGGTLGAIAMLPPAVAAPPATSRQATRSPAGKTTPVVADFRYVCSPFGPLTHIVLRGAFQGDLTLASNGKSFEITNADVQVTIPRDLAEAIYGFGARESDAEVSTLDFTTQGGSSQSRV